jgi:hypothetical protein
MINRPGIAVLAGLACLALALLSSRARADDFTCSDVRAVLATVRSQTGMTEPQAVVFLVAQARAGGASQEQIDRARKCLAK